MIFKLLARIFLKRSYFGPLAVIPENEINIGFVISANIISFTVSVEISYNVRRVGVVDVFTEQVVSDEPEVAEIFVIGQFGVETYDIHESVVVDIEELGVFS